MLNVHTLPTLNASLNALSAVLLVLGLGLIKAKRPVAHQVVMITALATSTLFLLSYITYHVQVGTVRFPGHGWIRPVYFTILTTHTILAIAIVPLVIRTVLLAVRRRFDAHRRWARLTWPLWMYVSVTGVVIYGLLYQSPWGVAR